MHDLGMFKSCKHDTPTLVFQAPVPIWAGAAMDKCPPQKGALIIDLADMYSSGIIGHGVSLPKSLRVKRVQIDWPDMGTAYLSHEDWIVFADWLKQDWRKQGVYIACQAGHGRTGTALAILGRLLGAIPDDVDPIEYVRKHYCNEAVESFKQVEYVEYVLDVKLAAKASKGSFTPLGTTPYTSVPCIFTIQGTDCKHSCYGTALNHKVHWCRTCKWDWEVVTTGSSPALHEKPSPELSARFPAGHVVITTPAPLMVGVITNKPAVIKSAEESAQTFLAKAVAQNSSNDTRVECNAVAKTHENTDECFHICGRWENHAGTHECSFCKTLYGGSKMACAFEWHNREECMDHICNEVWGHTDAHMCTTCFAEEPQLED